MVLRAAESWLQPDARLAPIELLARRICAVNPYNSLRGKLAVTW